jgi:uncharacterized protein
MNKRTVIIGASNNPERYAFKAAVQLMKSGHSIFPIGIKKGETNGIEIINEMKIIEEVNTVTLYLNPELQKSYYDYILALKPRRVIFNPGTENVELEVLLNLNKIEPLEACTLVMLATNQY